MKIAEPRAIRVMQFIIYAFMAYTGIGIMFVPPSLYQDIVGVFWVYVLGSFVSVGSVLGLIAVLPGIWWLERVGLLLLGTGVSMYVFIAILLGQSPLGIAVFLAFIVTFIQRWTEIRGSQLAPKEPREE